MKNEQDTYNSLYIPANIRKRKEYIDGIGNSEVVQILIGCGVGILIGIFLYAKYRNFLVLFFPGLFVGAIVLSFVRKDTTGRSTVDRIMNSINFSKEQKKFYYRYTNIYEKEVDKHARKDK